MYLIADSRKLSELQGRLHFVARCYLYNNNYNKIYNEMQLLIFAMNLIFFGRYYGLPQTADEFPHHIRGGLLGVVERGSTRVGAPLRLLGLRPLRPP